MIDDALDLGAEALASFVGWRARRKQKAAGRADAAPLPDGEFAVWELGAVRSRPAGRISVHGDTVRWAGPDPADPAARVVAGHEVRFRVAHSSRGSEGTRVRLQLPGARPLTVTVSHEECRPQGRPDPDEERRLEACAAELVDLLRRAGAVQVPT